MQALAGLTKQSEDTRFRNVFTFAHCVIETETNIGQITNPLIFHRLRKVGEYRFVCDKLLAALGGLPDNVRSRIVPEQVSLKISRPPCQPITDWTT